MTSNRSIYRSGTFAPVMRTRKRRRGEDMSDIESRPTKKSKIANSGRADQAKANSIPLFFDSSHVCQEPKPPYSIGVPNHVPLPSIREVFPSWPRINPDSEGTIPIALDPHAAVSTHSLPFSTRSRNSSLQKEEVPIETLDTRNASKNKLSHRQNIFIKPLAQGSQFDPLFDKMFDITRANFPSVNQLRYPAPLLQLSNSELFKLLKQSVFRHHLGIRHPQLLSTLPPLSSNSSHINGSKSAHVSWIVNVSAYQFCSCGLECGGYRRCIAATFVHLLHTRSPYDEVARMVEQETNYKAENIRWICEILARWELHLEGYKGVLDN